MKKWLILSLVALLSFTTVTLAGQPKLRGPSRSLSSRPRISRMKDRGKSHVHVFEDTRKRGSLYRRNRRGSLSYRNHPYRDRHFRPAQPIIVIVHVIETPITKPKPIPVTVRLSTHVTIFVKSSPNSRRFGAKPRGMIIFPKKPVAKTKP